MREPTNKLSARLRQLRKDAGLSGVEAARRAGLSQSKISRTETGAYMPTPEQVQDLCRAYHASPADRRELVEMARELREDRIAAHLVLERGGWWLQERIGRIEQIAGRIRSFTPTVVQGLAQTREYARALFGASLSPELPKRHPPPMAGGSRYHGEQNAQAEDQVRRQEALQIHRHREGEGAAGGKTPLHDQADDEVHPERARHHGALAAG